MGMKCIGVDIGGTSVKIGLFETTGELLDKWEVKTRKEDGGVNILPDVAASIRKKLDEMGLDLKKDITGAGWICGSMCKSWLAGSEPAGRVKQSLRRHSCKERK